MPSNSFPGRAGGKVHVDELGRRSYSAHAAFAAPSFVELITSWPVVGWPSILRIDPKPRTIVLLVEPKSPALLAEALLDLGNLFVLARHRVQRVTIALN
jgi:hypothetical protein